MKNDIIEHLYKLHIINDEMRKQIYAYYALVDNVK